MIIIILPQLFNDDFCLQNSVMKKEIPNHATHSAIYGLGFIGAAIYYISHATGFWIGVLGLLKALLWPAFLVFEALRALHA